MPSLIHRIRPTRCYLYCLLLTGLAVSTTQLAAKVTEHQLENGMKVLIRQDHRSPIVVSQVWYRVGSSYEHDGITGISHALEHMMFKGTRNYPAGEFSRIISENGGQENAFTGKDYTAYFQTLERSRLEISLELEADRMRNLLLDADEFAKEIEVVKEERRLRTEDAPQSYTWEAAMATAYQTSPYRQPIIGWMQDLESMQVSDLWQWYQRWYGPDNAILVIAGDVELEPTLALVEKHFGTLPAMGVTPAPLRSEVRQSGDRRLKVKRPARLPWLLMLYKVPSLAATNSEEWQMEPWEPYALDVVAGILSGGNSARFPSRLVRGTEIASEVNAGYNMARRLPTTTFDLSGTPAEGHDIRELELALRREIRTLQQELVDTTELERVKAQVISSDLYQRDSVFYQALLIGMTETIGLDWRLSEQYVDNIKRVSAEQLQQVAQRYLVNGSLTVVELSPLPLKPGQRAPASGGGGHVH